MDFLLNNAATLEALAKLFSFFALAGGSIWAFFKWIVPQYNHVTKSWRDVQTLAYELQPNGGKSMRDAIDRMEKNITILIDHTHLLGEKQWAIVSAQPTPIFEGDADGLCVRANPAYLRLVERQMDEVEGYGWENILHPDDRESVAQWWKEAVEKSIIFDRSFRIVGGHSGAVYRVHCYSHPVFNAAGDTILGWIGRYSTIERLPDGTAKPN